MWDTGQSPPPILTPSQSLLGSRNFAKEACCELVKEKLPWYQGRKRKLLVSVTMKRDRKYFHCFNKHRHFPVLLYVMSLEKHSPFLEIWFEGFQRLHSVQLQPIGISHCLLWIWLWWFVLFHTFSCCHSFHKATFWQTRAICKEEKYNVLQPFCQLIC